jgi:hypothetical protein
MWDFIVEMGGPMVGPFLLTGFLYYTFEVVGPYAEKQKQFEEQCEKKGGFVYSERRSPPICINKDAIIL